MQVCAPSAHSYNCFSCGRRFLMKCFTALKSDLTPQRGCPRRRPQQDVRARPLFSLLLSRSQAGSWRTLQGCRHSGTAVTEFPCTVPISRQCEGNSAPKVKGICHGRFKCELCCLQCATVCSADGLYITRRLTPSHRRTRQAKTHQLHQVKTYITSGQNTIFHIRPKHISY